jgi:hypothetical protein
MTENLKGAGGGTPDPLKTDQLGGVISFKGKRQPTKNQARARTKGART